MSSPDELSSARDRVARVFRFLQALNQHRNPAPRLLREQPWSQRLHGLPEHPSVRLVRPVEPSGVDTDSGGGEGGEVILRVRRPSLTPPPEPPEVLEEWLLSGWRDPFKAIETRASRNELGPEGKSLLVRFEHDAARVAALAEWRSRRDAWVHNERPAVEAMGLFERLYELHGRLEREGERLELVVGDGLLSWRRPEGGIFHPVLLQRVQLGFDPSIPEFSVTESGRPPDLYSELFRTVPEVDGRVLARCRDELLQGGFGPLGSADTSGFLRRLVAHFAAQANFREDGPPRPDAEPPQLGRDPVLFLRTRSLGFARILEGILEDLDEREELPPALLRTVGADPASADAGPAESAAGSMQPPIEVLLSKPANPEQEEIAQRLAQHGCVLVQGPPGTGKTHTIANLVGHLLAQGKSVLVTSHTTKALKVLRDQVVPELRPLCVSVLESDLDSRKQLEGAVGAIAERLSSSDAARLDNEADVLAGRRKRLVAELQKARAALLDAQSDEYRDVVLAGQSWAPSQAARKVAAEAETHQWMPGPVRLGAALSLSDEEVRELYRTNREVSAAHEGELARVLPAPQDILSPQDFVSLLERRQSIASQERDFRAELWASAPHADEAADLEDVAARCARAMAPLGKGVAWKLAVAAAGASGEADSAPWQSLLSLVERVRTEASDVRELLLQHAPHVGGDSPLDEQLRVVGELQEHVAAGGSLGVLALLPRPAWKRFLRSSRVATGVPRMPVHFDALAALLRVRELRQTLCGRWDRQMALLGAPASALLGDAPEESAAQLCAEIRRSLGWAGTLWAPLERDLELLGLRWRILLDEAPVNLAPHGALLRLRDTVLGDVTRALRARARALELARVEARLRAALRRFDTWGGHASPSSTVRGLVHAAVPRDTAAYARAFAQLVDVHGRRQALARRQELLARLDVVGPGWATAIRERQGPHGHAEPPGEPLAAWCWRQLHDELERRGRVQLADVQAKIDTTGEQLRRTTAELIERRAWAAQVRRTTLAQQQALVGWLDTVRRIGKGTGRRTPQLRAAAAQQMNECREAVPVWVMPLAQVVENFNAATRFDVVIIDEASQSDAMALIALYMAKSAVVVGDHEQVSPSAVGQNLDVVEHLISQYLEGIPNAHLYDGKLSVYDLARASFGGMVCLTEHFRCVPDIIEFSNQLSYEGRIKPLREAASARVAPALLVHRVEGRAEDKVNPQEALTVASLIAAAVERPEYAGLSFGVISLVGEDQALEVERILRSRLHPAEYERRRLLCGNAAQFQGDERDVMFLTMVDSHREGPLSKRDTQDFKQRFNVAVSRARDQLWVVHSLNPSVDLKPGDLRRRLLEHCTNPRGVEQTLQRAEAKLESPFERDVLARLVRAGYRVTPQWPVGHYRIDLVVEGGGRRLAIECDGDRFHPLEKLPEDMARQAILERLGWRFVRLRGSAFFRDPEAAMAPLFAKLREFEIPLEGEERVAAEGATEAALRTAIVQHAEALQRKWKGANSDARLVAQATEGGHGNWTPSLTPSPRTVVAEPLTVAGAAQLPVSLSLSAPLATAALGDFAPKSDGGNATVLRSEARTARPSQGRREAASQRPAASGRASPDPLPDAVAALLPENAFVCATCKSRRRLWVGEKGPFLKCDTRGCGQGEGVEVETLAQALRQIAAKCSCHSPVRAAIGRAGHPTLVCANAACTQNLAWKELRDRLRNQSR
ncbi:DUF559 domain-containing protein [Corallococcus sp. AB045]|uniref:AAA domain-containing protein n=1 Tax=Corallococcus sp. AB045 TaxID=2316719 RepID=UPI000EE60D3A|nr:AAA domain-containing protein [Corallococcus sp. AB045]RKH89883.1 DUF559 domain-containing protein [Corallococcus sp. AB045]